MGGVISVLRIFSKRIKQKTPTHPDSFRLCSAIPVQVSTMPEDKPKEDTPPPAKEEEPAKETTNEEKATDKEKEVEKAADLPTEVYIKHPLQHEWTIWYMTAHSKVDFNDRVIRIQDFGTVEDFWSIFHHIRPASLLQNKMDYMVFKKGIQPQWEDGRNKNGGKITVNMQPCQRGQGTIDNMWLEVVLTMIGEGFEPHGEEICGSVVSLRKSMDRLSLWIADSTNRDANRKVGEVFRKRVNWLSMVPFERHADTASKSGSSVKCAYHV